MNKKILLTLGTLLLVGCSNINEGIDKTNTALNNTQQVLNTVSTVANSNDKLGTVKTMLLNNYKDKLVDVALSNVGNGVDAVLTGKAPITNEQFQKLGNSVSSVIKSYNDIKGAVNVIYKTTEGTLLQGSF